MFLKRLTDKKSAGGCEDEQMQQIEQIDELEHEKKNRLKISAVITKKNIVVLASLILIGGAVGLNWVLFSGDTSAGNSVSSGTSTMPPPAANRPLTAPAAAPQIIYLNFSFI